MDHIFVELQAVRHRGQRREFQPEFVLGWCHFVVMLFRIKADISHDRQHLGAHVLLGIHRRHREIAALWARAVAHIAHWIFLAGIDRQFGGIEAVSSLVRLGGPTHVIEHEELGFRSEEHRVTHAARLHIGFGLFGRRTWVAVVSLARDRVQDVTHHGQRGLLKEWVNHGRAGVRHQHHVGLVDRLPASNG